MLRQRLSLPKNKTGKIHNETFYDISSVLENVLARYQLPNENTWQQLCFRLGNRIAGNL